jgi:hypothetical protein
MDDRLTYEFYKGNDTILLIDLHNEYSVVAIKLWNKEKHNYTVELYLKDNQIDTWEFIEDTKDLVIDTNYKFINSAILKQVAQFLENGFFVPFIERYEYEIKCFERGNELFEKERKDTSDDN